MVVHLSLMFSIGKVNWLKAKVMVESAGTEGPLPATILQTLTTTEATILQTLTLDHMPWDSGSTVSSS